MKYIITKHFLQRWEERQAGNLSRLLILLETDCIVDFATSHNNAILSPYLNLPTNEWFTIVSSEDSIGTRTLITVVDPKNSFDSYKFHGKWKNVCRSQMKKARLIACSQNQPTLIFEEMNLTVPVLWKTVWDGYDLYLIHAEFDKSVQRIIESDGIQKIISDVNRKTPIYGKIFIELLDNRIELDVIYD